MAVSISCGRLLRLAEGFALALILILAGYLRLVDVAVNPGWYTDEGTHLDIAHHLRDGEVRYLAIRGSTLLFARPPLFSLLLAGAVSVSGDGMSTLRALTAWLGTLSVGLLYSGLRLGERRWDETRDGLPLLAAALLAIYPAAVLYSRFGFSYNLLAPLVLLALLGLWGYWATRGRRWLAVAATAIGLGLITDLWAGALLAPLTAVVLLRRPRDLAWSLPLAALPFGLYAAGMLVVAPGAFLFDLRFTLARLNAISLERQLATLTDNVTTLAIQDPWFAAGAFGLLVLRPATLRNVSVLMCGLTFLALGRTVALYSLSAYYLIPLLPFVALGLAALMTWLWALIAARAPRVTRPMLLTALVVAAVLTTADTLRQVREGFTTPIDIFLAAPADAQAVAAFLNARLAPDEVVIASPAVAWMLRGRPADFQMAVAATGHATVHLPADLPAERFAFDPRFSQARFVVVDNLWRNWAAVHIPEVDGQLRAMENWPVVFQAGAVTVYQNPARNSR